MHFEKLLSYHILDLGHQNHFHQTQRYGAILGGKNNTVNCNVNAAFIVGSDITADRGCTTFMNSLDTKGDVDFELSCIPTSDSGLRQGQIYRTGSAFDEIRIKL